MITKKTEDNAEEPTTIFEPIKGKDIESITAEYNKKYGLPTIEII